MTDSTTALLNQLNADSPAARDSANEAFKRLEKDLKKITAQAKLRVRRYDSTVDTTGIVDEVFVKLMHHKAPWLSREQFLAFAAACIRHKMIDVWRKAVAIKRLNNLSQVSMPEVHSSSENLDEFLDLVREAFETLGRDAPRVREIMQLYWLEGLKRQQIADRLQIKLSTVKLRLRTGLAFIRAQFDGNDGASTTTH